MANVTDLARALSDVYLGDLIKECVVVCEDNKAYIKAMDITSSLFVQTSAEIDHADSQFGISDLGLFVRYLNTIKETDVTIKQKDNVLTLKPKSGAAVKYLLAEVDLIPSYDEGWEDDILEKELVKYGKGMPLTKNALSKLMSVMGLFAPNSVYFEVNKKGVVNMHGGKETGHQFDVELGKVKSVDPCIIKMYGKHITPILSIIDFATEPTLFIKEDEDIIISTSTTSWIVQPTSDE